MSPMTFHSYKYDGSLHYRYPVEVVERSAELLVTYAGLGVAIESYRGSWVRQKRVLSHFWRGRPYVLHVCWGSAWEPESFYVDIATGTKWDHAAVNYIDLDMDLILRPEAAEIHLDDADEFEVNRVRWNYPAELVAACWGAVEEVRGLLTGAAGPFDPRVYAWRPAAGS